ncbi:hypothetical protein GCM10009535_54620 [Streptomyces thermocarboxydovorans]|uniref:Uncharacterized protein n=1 Tax=Streptomyces thermocarboxydovorans TaxID=59298 RepID=A0ABP3T4B4_9ACTN
MPSGGGAGVLCLPILPGRPKAPSAPAGAARLTMRPGLDTAHEIGILALMLIHATFVFTYGNRPAGCHGRAA